MPDPLDRRRGLGKPHQHARPPQRLVARVHRVARHRDRRERLDPVHDLDLVPVRLPQTDPLPAAGLVDPLHRGRPRRLRDPPEVVRARGMVREPHERRVALLRHVEVVGGVRAPHVERVGRPRRPHHAEVGEEFLHDV